ncbi:TerL [Rhodoferax koreense]|uniref:TerL n=1 Tax=Rhodoferax koreensis TaxID=1842727 RepID=A0A1P8JXG9_9BURK|nr:TerL [Rhodoferax koreense]APW38450.1 TerL [Rhodoferax koreense]
MTPQIEYTYVPQGPTLEQYILSTAQRTFICGPLGSSKTNASCWKSFRVMLGQAPDSTGARKTRILAVRNTYSDLFSTTIKDWLEMFEGLGKFNRGGLEPPTHHVSFDLPDGTFVDAEMIFLALDRPDHIKKLRGMQLTAAWLNEVKELVFAVLEMMDLRVGRFPQAVPPTWYGMFGDTNAPDNDHWYYRLAEEVRPEGWVFLKQPGGLTRKNKDAAWEPNPLAENVKNLPLNYYINGAQGKTEAWILVNLANEYGFVADGKPVYPDYRDSTHCKEFELVPNLGLHIGLDFGLTPAAWIGQHLPNGQWRIRYELVTTDTGVIRFALELKRFLNEKCHGFPIVSITGDPAGDQRQAGDKEERTVFQLLEANGIPAVPAHTNVFATRTEAVNAPMRRMIDGQPGFLLHPDCKVSRKGMQGDYKFRRMKVSGDERYMDVPVKNASSHPCEAGQYLMLGGGEGVAALTVHNPNTAADAAKFRRLRGNR